MWFSANGSDNAAHGRGIRGCSPARGSAEWISRVRKLRARVGCGGYAETGTIPSGFLKLRLKG